MSKQISYIILGVLAVAILLLLVQGRGERKTSLNLSLTFDKQHKIPYGAYIAYNGLKHIFPEAKIVAENAEPGYWATINAASSNQLLLIITPQFYTDDFEMKKLIAFAEKGNNVFVSTRYASQKVYEMAEVSIVPMQYEGMQKDNSGGYLSDKFTLLPPYYNDTLSYQYKGVPFWSSFVSWNKDIAEELGGAGSIGFANFLHFKAGEGNFFLHLSPISFTNYFLLQEKNYQYYENVLSAISPHVNKVVWDEYYINKQHPAYKDAADGKSDNATNSLAELFKYRETKWALIVALLSLLLYVLMEMRRKQRYIPIIKPLKNESVDFVQTVGRLYYEKGNHHNLSKKMAAHFLDYVRSSYKLKTNKIDDNFTNQLIAITGGDRENITAIVSFLHYLEQNESVTADEMTRFYRQLEFFYQSAKIK